MINAIILSFNFLIGGFASVVGFWLVRRWSRQRSDIRKRATQVALEAFILAHGRPPSLKDGVMVEYGDGSREWVPVEPEPVDAPASLDPDDLRGWLDSP